MYSIRRVVWNVLLNKKGGVECTHIGRVVWNVLHTKGNVESTP